jgi:outer membrane protein assembly factor BamB
VPCGRRAWESQVWNEARFTLKDGVLTELWRFESDWKPAPVAFAGWEPVFQPAIYQNLLYVPGAGGSLFKVNRGTGEQLARISPFGSELDPTLYVAGGLAVDVDGTVYYHALKLHPTNPNGMDVSAWLVKVTPDGKAKTVPFSTLVPNAPKPSDPCKRSFPTSTPRPWPPPPDASGNPAQPPSGPCLSQRPTLNITPAIGEDGTVYTVSRTHGSRFYTYLVAVNPDLTPKWATSMRGILNDGCGVLVPADATDQSGDPRHCRVGATLGVDPATNEQPAGVASDLSSSSPVVLPDGTVLYGAVTSYNGSRGHLFRFAADGKPLQTYDFGWDLTPAYYKHDGTFSILIKDNHYQDMAGPFFITQLSPDLKVEWQFKATNTTKCKELPDGTVECEEGARPNGFEWCVNAPAVDPNGTSYVNSEDGHLYAIDKTGKQTGSIFLNFAEGSAYTPVALDAKGRIFAINGGVLTVVGE